MNRGDLSQTYYEAATSPPLIPNPGADLDERARITAFNFNIGDLARDVGMIPSGIGIARSIEFNALKEKRDEDRKRQEMMDAIRRLDEINRRLADLHEERRGIIDDMRETQERINTLSGAIEQMEADGDVERHSDGSIRDPNIQARLREYEARTGQRVNRHDPEILLLALREQLAHEAGEMGRHEARKRHVDTRIDDLWDEAEQHIETVQRNDPDADIDSLRARLDAHHDGVSSQARISDEISIDTVTEAAENRSDVYDEDYNEVADENVGFGFDIGADDYESFADQAVPIESPEPSDAANSGQNPSTPDPDMSGPDDQQKHNTGTGSPSGPGMGGAGP